MLIKLRAWDKEHKKFYYFTLNGDKYEDDTELSWFGDCIAGKHAKDKFDLTLSSGEMDVDGKEIYEGDILIIDKSIEYEVSFECGCFILIVPWIDTMKIPYPELKCFTRIPAYTVKIKGHKYGS